MAAAGGLLSDICEEATCSICLDYFTDPVIITECGHNFCQACLTQCWGKSDTEACCPQCREIVQERNFRPNRPLANVAEIAKKLRMIPSLQGEKGPEGKGRICEKHQEPLKLFCKDHDSLICVVCDRSKEHENHKVIPLDEASQEYKDLIYSHVENLRKERENILSYKAVTEKESQDLLEETQAEKQRTMAAFRKFHQFLEEQEKLLLTQMEKAEEEMSRRRDEHLSRLSEELSSLEKMIQEVEEKCLQPAGELLQDIGSTMQRCQTKEPFKNPVVFSPALKWKIWDFVDSNPFLEGVFKKFKDTLESGLPLQKANVTLDPDTAHSQLILSKNRKSVRWSCDRQDVPDNPERFDRYEYVLGCEEFRAGRHFWEVTVGSEEQWAVEVSRKTVKRKGIIVKGPEEGIWDMEKRKEKWFSRLLQNPPLPRSGKPKRIKVSLNCEGGRVAFFDAESAALLHIFSGASFAGETLLPFFCVRGRATLSGSP